MRWIICISIVFLSCKTETRETTTTDVDTVSTSRDTVRIVDQAPEKPAAEVYANNRFRNVTAEKISENQYRIRGEGQIFEASFNWVIEDGHNELKKGFEMTDAGAPEWGKFDFTVALPETMNATLTLILFEASAMDGSRQHELAIPL